MTTGRKQNGATLVFSLVILIALSMIGITSIQSTRTELAMAGNQRESGLMFQAAEMGLVDAENFIIASTDKAAFNRPALGLFTVLEDAADYRAPDYFDPAQWDAGSQIIDEKVHGLDPADQPRYMIEYLGDRSNDPLTHKLELGGGYGVSSSSVEVSIFRSTSRGQGLTGNAYRYIQSYFGKEI